jgi:hypothetical protein
MGNGITYLGIARSHMGFGVGLYGISETPKKLAKIQTGFGESESSL